jgi:hypothetical protein
VAWAQLHCARGGLKNLPQVSTICFSGSSFIEVMIKGDKSICSNYAQGLFQKGKTINAWNSITKDTEFLPELRI